MAAVTLYPALGGGWLDAGADVTEGTVMDADQRVPAQAPLRT